MMSFTSTALVDLNGVDWGCKGNWRWNTMVPVPTIAGTQHNNRFTFGRVHERTGMEVGRRPFDPFGSDVKTPSTAESYKTKEHRISAAFNPFGDDDEYEDPMPVYKPRAVVPQVPTFLTTDSISSAAAQAASRTRSSYHKDGAAALRNIFNHGSPDAPDSIVYHHEAILPLEDVFLKSNFGFPTDMYTHHRSMTFSDSEGSETCSSNSGSRSSSVGSYDSPPSLSTSFATNSRTRPSKRLRAIAPRPLDLTGAVRQNGVAGVVLDQAPAELKPLPRIKFGQGKTALDVLKDITAGSLFFEAETKASDEATVAHEQQEQQPAVALDVETKKDVKRPLAIVCPSTPVIPTISLPTTSTASVYSLPSWIEQSPIDLPLVNLILEARVDPYDH